MINHGGGDVHHVSCRETTSNLHGALAEDESSINGSIQEEEFSESNEYSTNEMAVLVADQKQASNSNLRTTSERRTANKMADELEDLRQEIETLTQTNKALETTLEIKVR